MPTSLQKALPATPRSPHRRLPLAERLASIIATQNDLVAADLELSAVQRHVAVKAQRLTGASCALVELVEGGESVLRAATASATELVGTRLPLSASLSGLCVETGEAVCCADTEEDPRVNRELARRMGARSMVVVPLRHAGRAVGVLKVIATTPHAFGSDDVDTLQLMSGLLGAALARAQAQEVQAALVRQREEAVRALEQKNAMLRTLMESSPFLMGVVQREGGDFRHIAESAAAEGVLGRSSASTEGRLASELGASASTLADAHAAFAEAERTGRPALQRWSRQGPEGRRHFVTTVGALPLEPDQPHRRFCFFTEEVTERVRASAQADLRERMAMVGRLAAGVAHEANNPLAFAISSLHFISEYVHTPPEQRAPEDCQEARDALTQAQEGVERVRRIVKELHAFAHADSEPLLPLQLAEVAERAIELAGHRLGPGVQLECDLQRTPELDGSRTRLTQLVLHLLLNAAQSLPACRSDGPSRIRVATGMAPDGRVMLEVEDNGRGIAPDVLPRIFDPFFTTRPVGQGIGLGLTTCHVIARDHGGELTADSALGAGSLFRLLLPPAAAAA